MAVDKWIVKNLGGEEVGIIKRLILNPVTRQISSADVVLGHTGQLIRVPWGSFDLDTDAITLTVSESQMATPARAGGTRDALVMDVWP